MSSSPDRGPVLKEGEKVGHYEIREFVGEGPLGRVYKVLDTQFDVIAALKVLHPSVVADRGVRQDVINVFRSLIEFESDGFVKIFDADTQSERTFIAMDYLEGLSLRRLMEVRASSGAKFSWDEAEPIIESICQALESMRPGEVHGDLKPENIIILADGVKLTDLHLGRIMPPAQFVAAQVLSGNAYLAPELAERGDRLAVDPAVDVYAIGVILYQLLTGVLPAPGATHPGKLVNTVPSGVDALVARALAADPDARFAHPAELHLEIARMMGKPEVSARLEIFMHDVPERAPFATPEPVAPPPPPAAPSAKTKSLFDDALLGEAEDKPKAAPQIKTVTPPPAKSKTPLIAAGAAVALLAAGAIGFMATRPQEPPVPTAQTQVAPKLETPKPDLKAAAKKAADEALAKAEKARDDALKVSAEKSAPDLFVAAMKSLRDAGDRAREEKYADAVSLAVDAERAFGDAIIKGVAAQAKTVKEAKTEARAAAAAAPAKREPCPSDMVLIPAGAFTMGAPSGDADRNPGEKYDEKISVPAFCIDRYEYPNKKGATPAAGVSWPQAKSTCESVGKRLCNETEWEKACKGPKNLKFPYGASFNAAACNTEDAAGNDRKLNAAGAFAACKSGYGVHDMSGNLWEWTESKLQSNLNDRVLRGGSYTRPDYHDRCANRYNSAPSVKDHEFGFRCCAQANE